MANEKEVTGAWVIHHGKKLMLDANGAAEFPAIDEAAKAASLLARLGQSDETTISKDEVKAIAIASGLNPRHELTGLLQVLQQKRLIDQSDNALSVLGVSVRSAVNHASDLFYEADPNPFELASLRLAEIASQAPVRRSDVSQLIGDEYHLAGNQVSEFLDRAEGVGFVDKEGIDGDRLLFNGNLFRRGSVVKSQMVLSSLKVEEQTAVAEVAEHLGRRGCMNLNEVESILTKTLFEKMVAAGMYDLNTVMNEEGSHVFVTAPAAFHKFVDPMVDDCFDMAKALVSALNYGMTVRSSSRGRIANLPALLGALINGREVGPTSSIGQDYRVLEIARVVQSRPDPVHAGRFYLRLLKREVGELALQVLTQGNAYSQTLTELPSAPMSGYAGPEQSRMSIRKRQTPMSKRAMQDVLEAVRGGRTLR